MSENKKNKLVVDDIDVIVRGGIVDNPYYEIRYREVGKDYYCVGFGSYYLNNVLKWKDEEFVVVSEKAEKETKEVTNKQILEHLKEIEIAHGCLANGINTLFSVMSERMERLKLSSEEVKIIHSGQIALACITDRMADISGMNEKVQKIEEEVHAVSKEDMEGFIDLLKEIFE